MIMGSLGKATSMMNTLRKILIVKVMTVSGGLDREFPLIPL